MCSICLCWNVRECVRVCLVWPSCLSRSTALSVDRRATPALMNTNRSVTRSSAIRTKRRCKTNPSCFTKRFRCISNWSRQINMESPPEPETVPRKSASEASASVEDSPVKPDSKPETDKPAPVRRQSCSSTNKGKLEEPNRNLLVDYFPAQPSSRRSNLSLILKLQSLHVVKLFHISTEFAIDKTSWYFTYIEAWWWSSVHMHA